MRAARLLTVIGLAACLAGCATPRYQTVYRYEGPADAAGRACLEQCQQSISRCQGDCVQAYQACVKTIEPLVADTYAEALNRYAADLERYAWDLRHYEMQFWLGWGHGPWYGGWTQYGWPYYAWPYPGWSAPHWYPHPPPSRPTRESVLTDLRRERCVEDCGCLTAYDACFLGCGGRKVPEVQCVENCPKSQ